MSDPDRFLELPTGLRICYHHLAPGVVDRMVQLTADLARGAGRQVNAGEAAGDAS